MPAAASAGLVVAGLLLAGTPSPDVVLTITDPALAESSGLAVSQRDPEVLWTHNDGGSAAQVIALDAHGDSVATVTLAGVDPYDPEALAPGPDDTLYLGDLGDNSGERPDVSVFAFAEPDRLVDQTVDARWYRFTYPDGPHDAEALLVAPDGRIMVATKELSGAGLYRAPRDLVTQDVGTNALTRVATVPALVTDGAYLPDGRFVLRTYTAVYVYARPGHQVAWARLPAQPQGESVAADGDRLLVGSEGVHSQVLSVPVPAASRAAPTGASAGPTAGPSGPASRRGQRAADPEPSSNPALIAGVLAAVVVLLGAVAAHLRRRRPPH